jgi:TatD DNase family protein
VAVAPLDRVLVETDAPYLTPTPFRGRPNASYLIPHTARVMAQSADVDEATMSQALWDNAQRVFGAW